MSLPNLVIAGAQKGGTTWLHEALSKSDRVFASTPKELGFFNRRSALKPERIAWYESHFPTTDGVEYYLESTPHYFRVPKEDGVDTAHNITQVLDDPTIVVILRHPVERYLSAYTHHVRKGRQEYAKVIDDVSDDHGMMTLGLYAASLEHWRQYFPSIKVLFHDDLKEDPTAMMQDLMAYLDLPMELTADDLDFHTNDKRHKNKRSKLSSDVLPTLSLATATELMEYYDDDIRRLEELVGRDLSHWRLAIPPSTIPSSHEEGASLPRASLAALRRKTRKLWRIPR